MSELIGLMIIAALAMGTMLDRRIRLGRFGRVPRRDWHRWDEGGATSQRRRPGIQTEPQASR